jgi:hypothetical protein
MPNMPLGDLSIFFFLFSAVILVITVLGGKEEVRCAYDKQTSPISSQRTGIYSTSQGRERERVVTEGVGGDRDRDG